MAIMLIASALIPALSGNAAASPGDIVLASSNSSGVSGNKQAYDARVSSDGQWVVFVSAATNLVPGASGTQVYSKDLSTGVLGVCSAKGIDTVTVGNGASSEPSASGDFQYVSFTSTSTNLVSGASGTQVYRTDLCTGQVKLASASAGGAKGNAHSWESCISSDGRYVVFKSSATNLIGGVSGTQVYRKDLSTGKIALCSSTASWTQGNAESGLPYICSSGRYVTFWSNANNFIAPAPVNAHVYRKDMSSGAIKLCSATSSGAQAEGNSFTNWASSDGRYVVFESNAANLVAGLSTNIWRIFRKDLSTGAVKLCSSSSSGAAANSHSLEPSVSADGRYVVFVSSGTNLVSPATSGGQAFRKDLSTGKTALCSSNASNLQGNKDGTHPAISADGRFAAFQSDSTNMGTATSSSVQVFLKEVAGPTPTWYLAEGSTAWGFDTMIFIENPNDTTVHAKVTYMTASGEVPGGTLTLPPMSQTIVRPTEIVGERDFSTRVVCTEGKTIAVDRNMDWGGPDGAWIGMHSSIGVTSPAWTWYLPEGSSAWGFECWLLIQNPNDYEAECRVTYMIEGEGPVTKTKTVPANSRKSFNMADDIGAKDASIKVESWLPVIPERAMYRNNRRMGHDSIGTTTPATDYYLAEGTTGWGFTTYVLVQNPNDAPTDVTLTYMTDDGPKPQSPFAMPANSRKTIRVNDVMPDTDFSTQVHGSAPIIAERSMYWDNGTGEEGHDSIGMYAPHTTFYLPAGGAAFWQTFTLVQNPNSSAVTVKVSYLLNTEDGNKNQEFTDTIPAQSRKTYNMADTPLVISASVLVTCTTPGKKIMVERSMYFMDKGSGTDTIGGYSD